jgi:hypothetical protein
MSLPKIQTQSINFINIDRAAHSVMSKDARLEENIYLIKPALSCNASKSLEYALKFCCEF